MRQKICDDKVKVNMKFPIETVDYLACMSASAAAITFAEISLIFFRWSLFWHSSVSRRSLHHLDRKQLSACRKSMFWKTVFQWSERSERVLLLVKFENAETRFCIVMLYIKRNIRRTAEMKLQDSLPKLSLPLFYNHISVACRSVKKKLLSLRTSIWKISLSKLRFEI